MAFETSVSLKDCKYTYSLHPNVKKYTLRDNTFAVTKVGNYELNRLLEAVPNSGPCSLHPRFFRLCNPA